MRGVEDGQSDHAGAVKNVNPGADYLDTTRRPNQQDDRLNQVATTQHPSHDARPTIRRPTQALEDRAGPNQQSETTPTPHDLYHRRET